MKQRRQSYSQPPASPAAQPQPSKLPPVNRAELLRRIANLADYNLHEVQAAVDSIDRGSALPVESFVSNILLAYASGHLSPQRAEELVKDFQADFTYALDEARFLVQRNPEHFRDLLPQDDLALRVIGADVKIESERQLQPAVVRS
jgi:hypothetical protein